MNNNVELKRWWEAVQDGARYLIVTRKTCRIIAHEKDWNKKRLVEKYGPVTKIITPMQYIRIYIKKGNFSQKQKI